LESKAVNKRGASVLPAPGKTLARARQLFGIGRVEDRFLAEQQRLKQTITSSRESRFQVVLVSHDPWEALELCETAVILDQGSVRGDGTLPDLLETSDSEPGPTFRHMRARLALSAVDSIRDVSKPASPQTPFARDGNNPEPDVE
jgi:ABC-type glutathione transport system ATPase component